MDTGCSLEDLPGVMDDGVDGESESRNDNNDYFNRAFDKFWIEIKLLFSLIKYWLS